MDLIRYHFIRSRCLTVSSTIHSDCDVDWDLQRIGENSYCFKYAGKSTWAEGVEICEENDSELPLPDDDHEDMDLYDYVQSLGILSIWLDGTDEAEEGIWVDSAGNNITFFNWREDQPDNNGGREHYIHYRPGWGGLWNDHHGENTDYILCQKQPTGK